MKYLTLLPMLLLAVFFAASPQFASAQSSYSLSLSDTTIEAGEDITVSWTANSSDNLNQDWIAVYKAGTGSTDYLNWKYTGSVASGELSIRVEEPGTYQLRYLKNNGYNAVVTSPTFTVESSNGGVSGNNDNTNDYSLTLDDSNIEPGDDISVSWTADSSDNLNGDWLAVYREGANSASYLNWKYTGSQANGNLSLNVATAGTYEIRYLKNNGYNTAVTSQTFTVQQAGNGGGSGGSGGNNDYSLTLADTSIEPGENITVSWTADSSDNLNQDWIALYEVGAGYSSYLNWKYTGSRASGDLSLQVQNAGTYELRYLKNNGSTVVATSQEFVVERANTGGGNGSGGGSNEYTVSVPDTTISPGEEINISWTADSSDNLNQDWLAVYRVGTGYSSYLNWKYTNAQSSGNLSLRVANEGTYEVRYLKNNGSTVVAVSEEFEVASTGGGGNGNGGGGTGNGYRVEPSQSSYDLFDTATAIWNTPSGNYGLFDWIGLYVTGSSDRDYVRFEYTDALSKRETFYLNDTGVYEFRYFTGNSYNKRATSDTFTVGDVDTVNTCNGYNLSQVTNLPSQNSNGPIIALGDSITFGIGASNGQNYVDELEKSLGVNIINEGVPADTTRDVLARLEQDVLSRDPKTVIVFIGGNDELRRIYEQVRTSASNQNFEDELDEFVEDRLGLQWDQVPLISRNESTQNLRTIINRIQATGANTIVVGFDNNIFNDMVYDDYQTVADQTGSVFIPDIYNDIFARPSRMADLIHPNNAGYDIVADRIEQGLECLI